MAVTIERKLTTIVSADFAGYSRLMSQDEGGTLATLKAHRTLMGRLIADSRGRIVGTAGDSMLAELGSVVQAVECAVQIQRALAEHNATLAPERQMLLRIGINLGDVPVEGHDLFGAPKTWPPRRRWAKPPPGTARLRCAWSAAAPRRRRHHPAEPPSASTFNLESRRSTMKATIVSALLLLFAFATAAQAAQPCYGDPPCCDGGECCD